MNRDRLGQYIQAEREKAHKTRKAFAASLDISAGHLNNIERGIRLPSTTLLNQIAEELHVPGGYLFQLLDAEISTDLNELNAVRIPDELAADAAERSAIEEFIAARLAMRRLAIYEPDWRDSRRPQAGAAVPEAAGEQVAQRRKKAGVDVEKLKKHVDNSTG